MCVTLYYTYFITYIHENAIDHIDINFSTMYLKQYTHSLTFYGEFLFIAPRIILSVIPRTHCLIPLLSASGPTEQGFLLC